MAKRTVRRAPVAGPGNGPRWGGTPEQARRLKVGREEVRLDALSLWADNPRFNDDAVPRLMELIRKHGFAGILVATPDGTVWAGNTRLKALRALKAEGWAGADRVWVEWRTFPSRQAAEEFALADNKAGEWADWDRKRLGEMFKERVKVDLEALKTATGFRKQEIDWALDGLAETGSGLDEVPDVPKKPTTRSGDLWEMGEHRLLCGDATKRGDVERLMGRDKAGLIATDPPYGIGYNSAELHQNLTDYQAMDGDGFRNDALQDFLEAAFRLASGSALAETAAWYIWHAMLTQGFFAAAAAAADLLLHRQIIWVKPQLIFGRGHYHWKHELCFYGWKRGHRPIWLGDRAQTTVWEVAYNEGRNDRAHPTQKPVELWRRPIENHLHRGGLLYEPFCGSGTTIIAAEQLARRCYAMEIDPGYCDVSVHRWEKLTGKTARRILGARRRVRRAPADHA